MLRIKIDLLEGGKPYYAKPFPIPKIQEVALKAELNSSINIGVLK